MEAEPDSSTRRAAAERTAAEGTAAEGTAAEGTAAEVVTAPGGDPHPADAEGVGAFVQRFGLWLEQVGLPRMAGRVLAHLLVCDPPHQSAEQLAEALSASRGSISTTTRTLVTVGLVERLTLPGDRRTYYRAIGNWHSLLTAQLRRVAELREIVDSGMQAMAGAPAQRRERLEQVGEFAAFWEEHLTDVVEGRAAAERRGD